MNRQKAEGKGIGRRHRQKEVGIGRRQRYTNLLVLAVMPVILGKLPDI